MQVFLIKTVPTIRNTDMLETEVTKIVHKETRENIKKYLEKNEFFELTRTERMAVVDYEKKTRENLIREIRKQIQEEQMMFQNSAPNKSDTFINNLIHNLHPDLYKSLGGMRERLDTIKKAA
jgi:hypothetical protein